MPKNLESLLLSRVDNYIDRASTQEPAFGVMPSSGQNNEIDEPVNHVDNTVGEGIMQCNEDKDLSTLTTKEVSENNMVTGGSDMDEELSTTIRIPVVRTTPSLEMYEVWKPDKKGHCKEHGKLMKP